VNDEAGNNEEHHHGGDAVEQGVVRGADGFQERTVLGQEFLKRQPRTVKQRHPYSCDQPQSVEARNCAGILRGPSHEQLSL
jgi:hypothetical protein